jgi:hypothetical protein
METIQQASIYKLIKQNKYLVHSLSRLQMGLSIASEPFVWLNGNNTLAEVVKQTKQALSCSKMGLPNPTDWKETSKEFLNSIGLKKQSDLYKDSIHVSVLKKNDILIFTPMKNEGSKGFINVSKEKIEVLDKASVEEISKALEEALSKCE